MRVLYWVMYMCLFSQIINSKEIDLKKQFVDSFNCIFVEYKDGSIRNEIRKLETLRQKAEKIEQNSKLVCDIYVVLSNIYLFGFNDPSIQYINKGIMYAKKAAKDFKSAEGMHLIAFLSYIGLVELTTVDITSFAGDDSSFWTHKYVDHIFLRAVSEGYFPSLLTAGFHSYYDFFLDNEMGGNGERGEVWSPPVGKPIGQKQPHLQEDVSIAQATGSQTGSQSSERDVNSSSNALLSSTLEELARCKRSIGELLSSCRILSNDFTGLRACVCVCVCVCKCACVCVCVCVGGTGLFRKWGRTAYCALRQFTPLTPHTTH